MGIKNELITSSSDIWQSDPFQGRSRFLWSKILSPSRNYLLFRIYYLMDKLLVSFVMMMGNIALITTNSSGSVCEPKFSHSLKLNPTENHFCFIGKKTFSIENRTRCPTNKLYLLWCTLNSQCSLISFYVAWAVNNYLKVKNILTCSSQCRFCKF